MYLLEIEMRTVEMQVDKRWKSFLVIKLKTKGLNSPKEPVNGVDCSNLIIPWITNSFLNKEWQFYNTFDDIISGSGSILSSL